MTITTTHCRDFSGVRSKKEIKKILCAFREEKKPLTARRLASILDRSERTLRDYLKYLHLTEGKLFIEYFEETATRRGKKVPAYRLRTARKENDAVRWWLESDETDSEGGHCD